MRSVLCRINLILRRTYSGLNSLQKFVIASPVQQHQRRVSFKALHPFYLAVHPDLFNGHPSEQKQNEESLKVLNSYLTGLENKQPVYSTSLTFYKKEKNAAGHDLLSTVRIKLTSKSTTETVRDIMKAFDLPHDALDKELSTKLRGWGDSLNAFGEDKHQYASFMGNLNVGIFHTKVEKQTLEKWIDENRSIVTKNQLNMERMQSGSTETLGDLKKRYGIEGLVVGQVRYSSSMVFSGLKQIVKMLDRYFPYTTLLQKKYIRFGDFNGMDQTGRIVFHINDVPSEWKRAVSFIPTSIRLLEEIERLEILLRDNCSGLRFIRPRTHQSIPVQMYLEGLENVAQNLLKETGDGTKRFKDVIAICDWDIDFVGTSDEGFVKVPLLTSRNILLSYIERNLMDIRSKRKEYLRNLQLQQDAILSCEKKLGLRSLEKDTIINTTQTLDACAKLEASDVGLSMKDWHVVLSRYYSVTSDGLVRLPWNFLLNDSL